MSRFGGSDGLSIGQRAKTPHKPRQRAKRALHPVARTHTHARALSAFCAHTHARAHTRTHRAPSQRPRPERRPAPRAPPERPESRPERRTERPHPAPALIAVYLFQGGAGIGTDRGGEGVKSSSDYKYNKGVKLLYTALYITTSSTPTIYIIRGKTIIYCVKGHRDTSTSYIHNKA